VKFETDFVKAFNDNTLVTIKYFLLQNFVHFRTAKSRSLPKSFTASQLLNHNYDKAASMIVRVKYFSSFQVSVPQNFFFVTNIAQNKLDRLFIEIVK